MTLTLQEYCKKHLYTIVERYNTIGGDNGGNYERAIVKDGEGYKYHLYYDRSRRKPTMAQRKRNLELMRNGDIVPLQPSRGWRNTTLDNRRRVERGCESSESINSSDL